MASVLSQIIARPRAGLRIMPAFGNTTRSVYTPIVPSCTLAPTDALLVLAAKALGLLVVWCGIDEIRIRDFAGFGKSLLTPFGNTALSGHVARYFCAAYCLGAAVAK